MIEGCLLPLSRRVCWLDPVTCLVFLSHGDLIEQLALFSSCPLTKILSSLSQHVCKYMSKEHLLRKVFLWFIHPSPIHSIGLKHFCSDRMTRASDSFTFKTIITMLQVSSLFLWVPHLLLLQEKEVSNFMKVEIDVYLNFSVGTYKIWRFNPWIIF